METLQAAIQCANCPPDQPMSDMSKNGNICLHCQKILCFDCFSQHVKQLKSHLSEMQENMQVSKAKWNEKIQVNIYRRQITLRIVGFHFSS